MKVKKIISILMVMILALSAISVCAVTENENESIDILVLGDSIAYGTNSSYCAGELAANCLDCNCTMLAKEGMKTIDLLVQLSSIKTQVQNAKNIFISIGGNDFLDPLMAIIESYRAEGETIEQAVEKMKADAVNVLKKYKETVITQLDPAVKNINSIVTKIIGLNPDAKIMLCNMYNPVESMVDVDIMFQILNGQFEEFVSQYNAELAKISGVTLIDLYKNFKGNNDVYANTLTYYKNFKEYDIHPSDEGQLVITALIISTIKGSSFDAAKRQVILMNYSDREITRLPAALKGSLTFTRINGDSNNDGGIDATDASLLLKYFTGKTTSGRVDKNNIDVNKDGDTDTADITMILKYDAGLIKEF